MRLVMSVFKERREFPDSKRLPQPLLEENAGTFFVSRFSLEDGRGVLMMASGRDPRELVEQVRTKLAENEPGLSGKRIPQISVNFSNRNGMAGRTLMGSENHYDMTVRTEGLSGSDISEFFREMEVVLENGSEARSIGK